MIRRVLNCFKAINDWGDYTQGKFVESMTQLETFKQLFFVLAVFGIPWLYAWNMHVISPWLDQVLGIGPHDLDSHGKIVWRRMWSSAICAPVITYALIKFTYNRYKLRSKSKGREN